MSLFPLVAVLVRLTVTIIMVMVPIVAAEDIEEEVLYDSSQHDLPPFCQDRSLL